MTQPDSSPKTDSPWLSPASPVEAVDESITMPQTIAGVFDEAFDLYKRHFALFAMIVAVGLIPVELIRNIVIAAWLHPLSAHLSGLKEADVASNLLLYLGQFVFGEPKANIPFPGLLSMVMLIALSAPISIAVSDLYFGRTTTARECYRRSRPYLFSMLSGYALLTLMTIGIFAVGWVIVFSIAAVIAAILTAATLPDAAIVVVLVLMCVPYFFWMAFIARNFVFLTPLTILEGLPPTYISTRNFQLVSKKRFWRTWAAASALPILWFSFEAILTNSLGPTIRLLHLPPVFDFTILTAVYTAVHFFLAPYWAIFVTLLYYDYRVRREGFDVRLLSLTQPEATPDAGGQS